MKPKNIFIPLYSKTRASYFGLPVRVLLKLTHYTMVRYGEREFVVDTGDLRPMAIVKTAA